MRSSVGHIIVFEDLPSAFLCLEGLIQFGFLLAPPPNVLSFIHVPQATLTSLLFPQHPSKPSHLLFSLPRIKVPNVCIALFFTFFGSELKCQQIRKAFPDHIMQSSTHTLHCVSPYLALLPFLIFNTTEHFTYILVYRLSPPTKR